MLLVFGSINADLLFKVAALPAPGETVLCPSYEMAIGGKGSNQAAAAAKAGAETLFVGHTGNDAYGPVVKTMLEEAGVDCANLRSADAPTAVAVIGVDEAGENSIIVASGANLATEASQLEPLLTAGQTLLCQNEIRLEETCAAIAAASAKNCRTMLNLAPAGTVPAATLDQLDYLIVNEHEARAVAGDTDADIKAIARGLAAKHNMTVVLTLGAAGAYAASPDSAFDVAALSVEPVDTTGAGDCFSGILAARLDTGMALKEALSHAAAGAALACLAVGAQTAQPTDQEIRARLAG